MFTSLLLLLIPALVSGVVIEGRVQFPDERPFNASTRITVDHELATFSRIDGSFTVEVPEGVHVVDVISVTHHFAQMKLQVVDDNDVKCLSYSFPGAPKQVVSHTPLVFTALATYEYFETKPSFSLLSILKNPMVLIMLVSVGMMVMMPKMMEGLEPEERERMKKQMEYQQDPTKLLSSFFGGDEEPAAKKKK